MAMGLAVGRWWVWWWRWVRWWVTTGNASRGAAATRPPDPDSLPSISELLRAPWELELTCFCYVSETIAQTTTFLCLEPQLIFLYEVFPLCSAINGKKKSPLSAPAFLVFEKVWSSTACEKCSEPASQYYAPVSWGWPLLQDYL